MSTHNMFLWRNKKKNQNILVEKSVLSEAVISVVKCGKYAQATAV